MSTACTLERPAPSARQPQPRRVLADLTARELQEARVELRVLRRLAGSLDAAALLLHGPATRTDNLAGLREAVRIWARRAEREAEDERREAEDFHIWRHGLQERAS